MTVNIKKSSADCTIPCNLCGSRSIEIISLKDRKGDFLQTVICKYCGLIWSDPRPDESKIRYFYSKLYRKEYKGRTRPKKKHIYRDAKEAMRRYLFFKDILGTNDSVLDIGAGNGVFVYFLRQLDINAKGVEPDENHTKYAKTVLNVPVSTLFSKDISKNESFNIVTLHHVLEHMTDPAGELKHIWSIIDENGYLVVEVPNAEDIKQDPNNRYHKAHNYTFNPDTLIALGRKAGFKAIKCETAPLNGNMSIIFQKHQSVNNCLAKLSGNYLKITKILNEHNNIRHFKSAVPYKKVIKNCFIAIKEQVKIRKYQSDKQIIDAVAGGEATPQL
ncbi:MAG: class I SAM-dependent methyltransferase [Desulfatiglandales bacterium]